MANQHTLTIPLSQATERQLLVHIASRMETNMSAMTDALDRLAEAVAKEIRDIQTDLLAQIDALQTDNEAAKTQLQEKVAELDGAVARVNAMSDSLDANDVQPEPTPEPSPEPEPPSADPTPEPTPEPEPEPTVPNDTSTETPSEPVPAPDIPEQPDNTPA